MSNRDNRVIEIKFPERGFDEYVSKLNEIEDKHGFVPHEVIRKSSKIAANGNRIEVWHVHFRRKQYD